MEPINRKSSIEKPRELRELINAARAQHWSRRYLSEYSIIRNWAEAAEVLGMSRMSIWRYRQELSAPPLPTFKSTIRRWAEEYGLPAPQAKSLARGRV
jgi:predicted DNA-binding transcriptional regulator AlpA